MKTLVIDVGTTIVGMCNADDGVYVPYWYPNMVDALPLIREADEVVTYNGWKYDLPKLGNLAGLSDDLPVRKHTDMGSVCWGEWCSYPKALAFTYCRHFGKRPEFPETKDPYLLDNQSDVYMTLKLWELWKRGELKIVDGQDRACPSI